MGVISNILVESLKSWGGALTHDNSQPRGFFHKPTQIFSTYFILTHTHPRRTSRTIIHSSILKIGSNQTRLTSKFFWGELSKENYNSFVWIFLSILALEQGVTRNKLNWSKRSRLYMFISPANTTVAGRNCGEQNLQSRNQVFVQAKQRPNLLLNFFQVQNTTHVAEGLFSCSGKKLKAKNVALHLNT